MSSQPRSEVGDVDRPDRTTLLAFSAMVLIGGLNFMLVKLSNSELPPLYGAAVRFAAAALVFFGIVLVKKMPMPRGRALMGSMVYGILNFGFGYAFLYFALTRLQVGTTSVIMALVPLLTLILAVLHGQEQFTWRGVLGGLLALAGIATLSLRSLGNEAPALYMIAAFLAACSAAESSVIVKGFPKAHPVTTNGVGMAVASILLLAASMGFREHWVLPQVAGTWLVLAWLVIVGSVGLFGLFVFVIKRWTASASVYALTLMPVIAVIAGSVFADETITLETVGGGLLVMLGVYIGALSSKKAPAQPAIKAA
jgi:drug/metabolite transporter (DMT)-like permease